ncbi:Protein gts1 [Cystobasidiomycetes sp. EMM_F5]
MSKAMAARLERRLNDIRTSIPGNDRNAAQPRWASANLGIFLCVSCATIHRSLGSHISRVKSISLDTWDKDQVETVKQMGNVKSNALYNPDPAAHPPPLNMDDDGRNSAMMLYIQSKYRDKAFMRPQQQSQFGQGSYSSSKRPTQSIDNGYKSGTVDSDRSMAPPSPVTPALTYTSSQSSFSSTVSRQPNEVASLCLVSPVSSQQSYASLGRVQATDRANTAPLPDVPRRESPVSLPTHVHHANAHYNPFNRQMTASAVIPSTKVSYDASLAPAHTVSHMHPYNTVAISAQAMPSQRPWSAHTVTQAETASVQHQSDVFADLAGLAISQPSQVTALATFVAPPALVATPTGNPFSNGLRPAFVPTSSFGQSLASNMAGQASVNPYASFMSATTTPSSTTHLQAQPTGFVSRNPFLNAGNALHKQAPSAPAPVWPVQSSFNPATTYSHVNVRYPNGS